MFEVSEAATKELLDYFKDKEPAPMRVFLKEKSCGGPRLVLGIDEQTEHDRVFEIQGLTYVVDKNFLNEIQPVKVDFINKMFQVTGSKDFGAGCAGCDSETTCS